MNRFVYLFIIVFSVFVWFKPDKNKDGPNKADIQLLEEYQTLCHDGSHMTSDQLLLLSAMLQSRSTSSVIVAHGWDSSHYQLSINPIGIKIQGDRPKKSPYMKCFYKVRIRGDGEHEEEVKYSSHNANGDALSDYNNIKTLNYG